MITSSALPRAAVGDYVELTKPRLSSLSVLTALISYLAARTGDLGLHFVIMTVGTALCAGGVAALNQYMEADTDALMRRTADRPIPSGRVAPGTAFVIGWTLSLSGIGLLFAFVNGLSSLMALLTMVAYLALYTPAKRWSRWSTEIGALAGALPPLIGWTAAEGRISSLGLILFGVLLFWQIPHFMAICWLYRRDYATVNFPMLSVRDESGRWVSVWSLVNAIALVAVSLLPSFMGFASKAYLVFAAVVGAWFIWRAVAFVMPKGREVSARRLFFASLSYLPLQMLALLADRWLISR